MEKFPLKGNRSVRLNSSENGANVGSGGGNGSTSYQSVNKKVCRIVIFPSNGAWNAPKSKKRLNCLKKKWLK